MDLTNLHRCHVSPEPLFDYRLRRFERRRRRLRHFSSHQTFVTCSPTSSSPSARANCQNRCRRIVISAAFYYRRAVKPSCVHRGCVRPSVKLYGNVHQYFHTFSIFTRLHREETSESFFSFRRRLSDDGRRQRRRILTKIVDVLN